MKDREPEVRDSMKLDSILQAAVRLAKEGTFTKEYITVMPDSSQVEVRISSGFHFVREHPHLVVRASTAGMVYIHIFSRTEQDFRQVLSHEQWAMEYTGDTIRDINGDGLKDFVVNWYGANGCCLKGFSNVYLLRPDKHSFSADFEFINPTFSPGEHVIRGVCYGHPGDTELYKYRWNNETVDTVEYVYYEKNGKGGNTGKLIVASGRYAEDHKVLRKLNDVPAEYKKIEGYDWFTGNLK